MASEADIELWDIDIDQSSVPGHPEAWTLAGYTWDPVGLVATRKAGLAESRWGHARNASPSTNPSGDNDSGGSNQNFEPGMEVEPQDAAACIDPESLASAPIYQPQPPGCKMMVCQVAGCGMCLEGMKGYFLRHRVCEEHSKAPVLLIGDVPSRLCQQCSKFHHVSAFEGSKRTCRVQLDRIRINKRIRRNRKLNAAASAALAAATGIKDDGDGAMLGESPARPASLLGGGRAKRPADSSGSGEGSWVYSRKFSRHGGAGGGAIHGAGSGTRGAGSGIGAGNMHAAAATVDAAAAAAGAAIMNETETLPESGASDTGSREHPRASLGVSGPMRWAQSGMQSSVPSPHSPPSPAGVPAIALAALGGPFSEAAGVAVLAHSPGSAITSGSGGSGQDIVGMQYSGFSYSQQQQPYQPAQRLKSLDSMPMPAADVGGPGSIAAAAAAAGLVNEGSMTALLSSHAAPVGADLASLVGQQDSAAMTAAGQGNGQLPAAGSPTDGFSGVGMQPLPGQNGHLGRVAVAAGCLQPLTAQDSGGSNGAAALEMTSVWCTTAAAADMLEASAGAPRAMTAERQLAPLRQQSLPDVVSSGPEAPLSASSLHPLLQQQLHQELLLQQQKLQQQSLEQQQGLLQHLLSGRGIQDALLHAGSAASVAGSSVVSLTDLAQQANVRLCQQRQQQQQLLLLQQQKLQQQPAAAGWEATLLEVSMQLQANRDISEAVAGQVSTPAPASVSAPAAEMHPASAGRSVSAALPSQAVAASQLSGPSNVTGRSVLGASNLQGTVSQGGDAAADCGGRLAPASHPSCGTNTLSSSKLVRMSLENDNALEDSSALLSNLIDLLQTQAAETKDGATDARAPWGANAARLVPTAISEPGSHGSGNGSLAMSAAAAAASNVFSGGILSSLADGVCGGTLATTLGDFGSTTALAHAGSDAVGSPQNAAATVGTARLGSLDAVGVGLPGAALAGVATAGARSSTALFTAAGLGQAPSLPVPVPGALAAAAASGQVIGSRILGGLGSVGLAAQLQEQALRAPSHQLLQQQLLLAQQQQLLRMQQAQVQAAPSVPAAGLLLSRLLDADSKTHHLSIELNGCLAEKQLLRRQLLATLSTCQDADAEHLAAAAMAAAGTGSAVSPAVAVPTAQLQPTTALPGLAPQLPLQRPLLGGLGATSSGLVAAPGLGLASGCPAATGLSANGLGGFPSLTGGLMGTAGALGAVGLGGRGLRSGSFACVPAATPALDMQQMLQMGANTGSGIGIAVGEATAVVLGSAGSGLLGPGRPSAAAQLQALAEARAAAAAGAVVPPSGGPAAAASYAAPDLLTRVSLKIMNCLPDELPSDIRSRMQAFASQAPMDLVHGCLRPGCTEVVLDALHCGDEVRLVSELLRTGDANTAAAALLAALPATLHGKDIYLQAAGQVLCLRPGAPPRHASWAGTGIRRGGLRIEKPILLASGSMVLHVDGADMENCVHVRVRGKNLTSPGVTFLARMAGLALEVKIQPVEDAFTAALPATATASQAFNGVSPAAPQQRMDATGAASVNSGISVFPVMSSPSPSSPLLATPYDATSSVGTHFDDFDVKVQLPYNAPPQGLLILEPRAGVLLGSWAPVLLLEDAVVAAEVEGLLRDLEPDQARRLVISLGVFVDHAERCAAVLEAWERRGKEGRLCPGQERMEHDDRHDFDDDTVEDQEEDTDLEAASHASVESGAQSCCWTQIFGAAHQRVVRMGHTLLAYSALRGCPKLMTYLGSQLVDMGEPLSALPSTSYGGIELLPCSLLSGCGAVMSIAAAWGAKGGALINWRAQVPGQPSGVNLLHLAASLPLSLAVHALDSLWATCVSQPPAAADAFACAWFADDATAAVDAPSLLFRATISATMGNASAIEALLSGPLAADNLDRLCLLRLASSYIRTQNYMSPLDNVELPSTEVNSAAMSTAAAVDVVGEKQPPCQADANADDAVHDLDPGMGAASTLRNTRTHVTGFMDVPLLPTANADRAGNADRSGHGSVGFPPATCQPLTSLVASGGWSAALAASTSGGTAAAPAGLFGLNSPATAAAPVVPPRMRVSVAPKALAQAAATAGDRLPAAASRNVFESNNSWLAGGSSGADASCVPPSYTTNATTTLFASGSLPAFASGMTAAGMPPYGSSIASYYSHVTAATHGAAVGKPHLPMEPLVDMFRPLPESPSSGPDNCAAAAAACGPLSLASAHTFAGGFCSGGNAVAASAANPVGAMLTETKHGGDGATTSAKDGDRQRRQVEADAENTAKHQHKAESHNHSLEVSAGVADGGLRLGSETAAADTMGAEQGSETLRGHMRGLARMFKRLFKKGVPQDVGPVQQEN